MMPLLRITDHKPMNHHSPLDTALFEDQSPVNSASVKDLSPLNDFLIEDHSPMNAALVEDDHYGEQELVWEEGGLGKHLKIR